MFEVGTLVMSNCEGHYGITNEHTLCVVIETKDTIYGNDICVYTLGGDSSRIAKDRDISIPPTSCLSNSFWVRSSYFNEVTVNDWLAEGKDRYRSHYFEQILEYYGHSAEGTTTKKSPTGKFGLFDNLCLTPYIFSEEKREEIINHACDLYAEYNIKFDRENGVMTQWKNYACQKNPILAMLSKHPNWDDHALGIVFKNEEFSRGFKTEDVNNFCDWLTKQLAKYTVNNSMRVCGMTYKEASVACSKLSDAHDYMRWFKRHGFGVKVDGMTIDEMYNEYLRLRQIKDIISEKSVTVSIDWENYYVSTEIYHKIQAGKKFIRYMYNITADKLTAEQAKQFNTIAAPFNRISPKGKLVTLGAREGMNFSKIVLNFFRNFGFDKIKIIETNPMTGREKDTGWNKQFEDFCTAIKPVKIKRHMIISANFLDYMTASFGNGWGSCHTIDYQNYRDASSTHNACYRSGGFSYMGDTSSIVVYTIDPEYDGNEYWSRDKITRTMFHIGINKFCQGRTYPDNREVDKETSIAGQIRTKFCKVMEKLIELNGYTDKIEWTHQLGTSICNDHMNAQGTNYRDPFHYDDCGMVFIEGQKRSKRITFGSRPICPVCGNFHSREDRITCCKSM